MAELPTRPFELTPDPVNLMASMDLWKEAIEAEIDLRPEVRPQVAAPKRRSPIHLQLPLRVRIAWPRSCTGVTSSLCTRETASARRHCARWPAMEARMRWLEVVIAADAIASQSVDRAVPSRACRLPAEVGYSSHRPQVNRTMKTIARTGCTAALTLLMAGFALAQTSSGSSGSTTTGGAATGPNQGMTTNGTAPTAGRSTAKADANGRASKPARADVAFMKQAAENGHAEVESSKLAVQKATNAQVKSFAQQMVDDHTKANNELQSLASSKGVELPTGPSMMQKAKLKLLDASDGAKFDQRYSETMGVAAHRDTIALFQKASTTAKDAEVKAFATKTLPALQHHLEMARKLPGAEGRQDGKAGSGKKG
jgi:putative membrane protein